MSKFTFDTIQPYVEMLIDAIENKGASSSGISYNPEVPPQADLYRDLLARVRKREVTKQSFMDELHTLHNDTIRLAGNNQIYRIGRLLSGLDFFMMREYNRYNS